MSDTSYEIDEDENKSMDQEDAAMLQLAGEAEGLSQALESGFPAFLRVSGLYRRQQQPGGGHFGAAPEPEEEPADAAAADPQAIAFKREDFRLDVDARYPQMTASGTLRRPFLGRIHWIASLQQKGQSTWRGQIWYKDGNIAAFPYTKIKITAVRSVFPHLRKAIVRFSGGGAPTRKRTFRFHSRHYHPVEFEYDREQGVTTTLAVDTCAHPNRPASLPCENLKIEKVFRRAGFRATRNPNTTAIPTDGPDPNTTWSDTEMHDAMQVYWSRFANKPQWALWVLWAKQHDLGHGLGGIMYDSIGPNHRQGTAIFTDSFISDPPGGDPDPIDWVKRNHFWTAVHEMGHAFNLAHSWQKSLGAPFGTPWIPLADEPEARSFMNYPSGVAGGESAFFADFEYRFSDSELLFMRHAPRRFVQMGNADWFDHHGFEDAELAPSRDFALHIGTDRGTADCEFLEPLVFSVRVTNVSKEPKVVPADLLLDSERLVVIIKKQGKPARRWAPFARYFQDPEKAVLQPGDSMTESLFASAGLNGWDLAEPGHYSVQMAMEIEGRTVVSNPLYLRVGSPGSRIEEQLAQDVFTEDAGRVMAFDGSMVLASGINAWRELVERLPNSRSAIHARVALAMPKIRNYRVLRIDAAETAMALGGEAAFETSRAKQEEGRKELAKALLEDAESSLRTLGREDYTYYCDHFTHWLKRSGGEAYAKKVDQMLKKASALLEREKPAKGGTRSRKEKVKA